MSISPKMLAPLMSVALFAAACGSTGEAAQTGVAETAEGAAETAEGAAETAEAASEVVDSESSTTTTDTTTTLPETTTERVILDESTTTQPLESDVTDESTTADGAEEDEDSSPPTTGTAGLSSDTEAATVEDELACWRIENFNEDDQDRWRVINDGVMGGRSEGSLAYAGSVVRFAGTIVTDGGGFSMIRTSALRDQTLAGGLDGAEYLRVRIRSANGRAYELTVQDSGTNTAIMHFTDLAVSDDGLWQEVVVPLTGLEARVFGNQRPNLAEFDLEQISTLGIILADGLDGPFSLEIDRIDACASA